MMALVCVIVAYIIITLIFKGKLDFKWTFALTIILAGLMWQGYRSLKNPFSNVDLPVNSINSSSDAPTREGSFFNSNSTESEYLSAKDLIPGYEYRRVDDDAYSMSNFKRIDVSSGQIGDKISVRTGDFFLRVNSAELVRTYNGMTPMDGYIYLVSDVTMIFESEKMSTMIRSANFHARWGDHYEDNGYWIYDGEADLIPAMENGREGVFDARMESTYRLSNDFVDTTTATALAVFEVPILEGTSNYSLCYIDTIYELNPETNAFESFDCNYSVYFDLAIPEPTDEMRSNGPATNTYIGGSDDVVHSREISCQIHSAKLLKREDFVEGNNLYMVIDMTIKNETRESIELSEIIRNLRLHWGYHHKNYSEPDVDIGFYLTSGSLASGNSYATSLVYPVPFLEGTNEYRLQFPLSFNDDTADVYTSFNLSPPQVGDEMLSDDWDKGEGYISGYDDIFISVEEAQLLLQEFIMDLPNASSEVPSVEFMGTYTIDNLIELREFHMFRSETLDLGNGDRIIVDTLTGELYALHAEDNSYLSNTYIPLMDWVSGYFFTMVDPWTGELLIE